MGAERTFPREDKKEKKKGLRTPSLRSDPLYVSYVPPCYRGNALSWVVRASGGGGHSPWSDTGV